MPAPTLVDLLAEHLDRAYRGPALPGAPNGPSLRQALHSLHPSTALWRPAPDSPCAWEIALSLARSKFDLRQSLLRRSQRFPRPGGASPPLPAPANLEALRSDLQLLEDEHQQLCDAVRSLDHTKVLALRGPWRGADLVLAAAAHDHGRAAELRVLAVLRAAAGIG